MIEVGPGLFHASGPQPRDIKAELVAIALVRNEMWRLPFFLAYHRWLGIQHLLIIDNRSDDGTSDFLRSERDVTVIQAPGKYTQMSYLSWALGCASPSRWNLILDADELFVGPALRCRGLLPFIEVLNRESAAIGAASLVDCYPAEFPFLACSFEPVPWHRAPYFDRGPYFQWPSDDNWPRRLYHGIRERLSYRQWRWRKFVPRPLRWPQLRALPPVVIKTPLLRNVPGLVFKSVHLSYGARRSRQLASLLHYKFDVDLPKKIEVALRERQYADGSRYYEDHARMLARPRFDLRFSGTRRFEGVASLVDARLAYYDKAVSDDGPAKRNLSEVEKEIWQHGDYALQKQVWNAAWGTETTSAPERLEENSAGAAATL